MHSKSSALIVAGLAAASIAALPACDRTDVPAANEGYVFDLSEAELIDLHTTLAPATDYNDFESRHRRPFDCGGFGPLCDAVGREIAAELVDDAYRMTLGNSSEEDISGYLRSQAPEVFGAGEFAVPSGVTPLRFPTGIDWACVISPWICVPYRAVTMTGSIYVLEEDRCFLRKCNESATYQIPSNTAQVSPEDDGNYFRDFITGCPDDETHARLDGYLSLADESTGLVRTRIRVGLYEGNRCNNNDRDGHETRYIYLEAGETKTTTFRVNNTDELASDDYAKVTVTLTNLQGQR